MGYIKSGYCMIIRDFTAYCVPFATVSVEYAQNTVPWYEVELPDGSKEGFNETDLKYTKEEIEELCKKKNKEMEERRNDWFSNALPALERYKNMKRFGLTD